MASYTFRHKTTAGLFLYCNPMPQVESPWATTSVDMTEGTDGEYSCVLDSNTEYVMYIKEGLNKVITDPDEYIIPKNLNVDILALLGTVDTDNAAILAQLALLGVGGSETVVFSVSDDGAPIGGAEVYITSDIGGTTIVVDNLTSNAAGSITCRLDPGTYYAWVSHPNYTATNPQTLVVTDA